MFIKIKIKKIIIVLLSLCLFLSCIQNADNSSQSENKNNQNIDEKDENGNTQKEESKKIKCDYLYISYDDGESDLVNSVTNDLVRMANGLKEKDESLDIRILTMFDGIDSTSQIGKTEIGLKSFNTKYNANVADTRLFEVKGWSEEVKPKTEWDIYTDPEDNENYYVDYDFMNSWSEFSFDKIIAKDFTKECEFIPEVNGRYEINMADSNNIKKLLDFAYDRYEPKYILLKLSDHGTGTASSTKEQDNSTTNNFRSICGDDTTGSTTSIGEDQLRKAIEESKFKKVNILHLDACLECTIENAYELKNCTDYMVASPNISYGVPWDNIIGDFSLATTTPSQLAAQIALEVAFKQGLKPIKNVDSVGSTRIDLDTNNAPTYSYMDFTNGKVDNVVTKLSKVIDVIYDSMKSSEFFTQNEYWNKSLSEYVAASRIYDAGTLVKSYHPVPADYLIATDFSFLLARNVHGWVGNASDKIIVPYDPDAADSYKLEDNGLPAGKMTCMFYGGSYTQLVDIGYLMDMFILCTEYNDQWYINHNSIISGTEVTYGEFIDLCYDVVNALNELIPFSHRVNKKLQQTSDDNTVHERTDLSGINFYNNIMYEAGTYNTNLNINHYGITICATEAPSQSNYCYNRMGSAPTDDNSESYRHGNKFVKDTKWLEVLDYVFGTGTFTWGKYDMLAGDDFNPKEVSN